ncbi:hypothetical protein [Sporosarcina psychrophila]|uniref:hypothetical protein n=1 Tax=Sporosarcina psychrophila TaxID=1476 RepID=UPI0009EE89AE
MGKSFELVGTSVAISRNIRCDCWFSLSYFSNRTGKIKIIVKNNYLSSPREGIEKEKRSADEEIKTDYYYKLKKHITLNLELLFINSSSVNKVITDIEIEGISTSKAIYVGISLTEVEHYDNGQVAEDKADSFAPLSEHFHMISLKAGEARLIKLLAFLDNDHFENNSGIKEVQICYIHPEKRSKRKSRKVKFAINRWLDLEVIN